MPFEDETKDNDAPRNSGLKTVSSKKSIFDGIPKKPTQEEFKAKVQQAENQKSKNQMEAKELSTSFLKLLADKTLRENKSPFVKDLEKEVLSKMIDFGIRVNNDETEQEGMGSMPWVALLLNLCLHQRDRMNQLEYQLYKLQNPADLDKPQNQG